MTEERCKKCNGVMRDGYAIISTCSGYPDFPDGDVVTMSEGGPGKMISCLKCEICWWSVMK